VHASNTINGRRKEQREATVLLIWSYGLDCLWGLPDVEDVGADGCGQTLHPLTSEREKKLKKTRRKQNMRDGTIIGYMDVGGQGEVANGSV
jgi:hypothetical protein